MAIVLVVGTGGGDCQLIGHSWTLLNNDVVVVVVVMVIKINKGTHRHRVTWVAMEEGVHLPMEGTFTLYRQRRKPCLVRIDENGLTVMNDDRDRSKVDEVKASDLVGCVCMKAPPEEPQAYSAFFTVFAYPLHDKKRKRRALCFQVADEDNFEGNYEISRRWRAAVLLARRKYGKLGFINDLVLQCHRES